MGEFEQPILDYISAVVAESGGMAVTRETPLLEAGVLDSFAIVRMIQFVEEKFGVQIADRDIGPAVFASAATLTAYVERAQGVESSAQNVRVNA